MHIGGFVPTSKVDAHTGAAKGVPSKQLTSEIQTWILPVFVPVLPNESEGHEPVKTTRMHRLLGPFPAYTRTLRVSDWDFSIPITTGTNMEAHGRQRQEDIGSKPSVVKVLVSLEI